ncbi:tetrathionate reductase family octaheme c-type cytochrome [Desulfuromonas thiophila]|uniref:Octaheme c-type cytochrome, tetrathionate reductase family n=1 Tax=Desulfuromonas thiophila TaxID=57664 RepID=A0A1G6X5C1_9BACT|nr:tetrathionate reductase family octaheme c-type cytochrome [Desulfuromonas thiophila]SDD73352.1 octaheme c-type cytochrome, tetrathionate reductase family [Desulfuromonas thiophila]
MSILSNESRCTSCHAGYGWTDASFDFADLSRIDCLVCHDRSGRYKKEPTNAGWPVKDLDLKPIAEQVGHSSRASCGSCHFNGGGGDAIKHADMGNNLLDPDPRCDVHMGDLDFGCVDCHRTYQHRIAGRSSSVAPAEGVVRCEDCHSAAPHYRNGLLAAHLNRHSASLACNVCHSPVYAKCTPTKNWWDWSKAGDTGRQPQMTRLGDSDPLPDYHVQKGEFAWQRAATPDYVWFDGTMERVLVGDAVPAGTTPVQLTAPLGQRHDPQARITPFKVMKGVQAFDSEHGTLLIPHLFPRGAADRTAYWKNFDWHQAFSDGMAVAGLPYSGRWHWRETWTWWRVEHEVMPARLALTCVSCHDSLRGEQTCDRCHQDSRHVNFRELAHKPTDFSFLAGKRDDLDQLRQNGNYLDFTALGYAGDPILHGGRFSRLPLGRRPADSPSPHPKEEP